MQYTKAKIYANLCTEITAIVRHYAFRFAVIAPGGWPGSPLPQAQSTTPAQLVN